MISGPVTPRTRDGLWQLVRQRAELLERGLRIAVEDLDLSGGQLGSIDAILRDAGGRAVLLLLNAGELDPTFLARLLDGVAFLQRNGPDLHRALPESDLRFEAPHRVMVAGFRLHPELVQQLQALDLPDLHACEIEPFRVGGRERIVVRWLMRPVEAKAGPGFSVPAGLVLAAARTRCEHLLRTLKRLDPELKVEGDRFSRRVLHSGQVLCELWVDGDRLLAQVADCPPASLENEEQSLQFADRVLRHYLDLDRCSAESPVSHEPAQSAPRPVLAMETLRRSVAETRVSREEFSALGESVTEGEVPEE